MIGCILLLIYIIINPIILGSFMIRFNKEKTLLMYPLGFMAQWVIFHYTYLISLGLGLHLSSLCKLFIGEMSFFVVAVFFFFKNKWIAYFKLVLELAREWKIFGFIVLSVVFLQCAFKFFTMTRMALDDSEYVVAAADAIFSDRMWYINPYTGYGPWSEYTILAKRWGTSWIMYYACLAKIIGINAPSFAHTVLPSVVIIMAYFIYAQMGKVVFGNNRQAISVFLLALSWIMMNGWITRDNISSNLLRFSWHGRCILYAIGIPLLLYFTMNTIEKKTITDELTVYFFVINTCMVGASFMGCLLVALFSIIAFAYILVNKKTCVVKTKRLIIIYSPVLINVLIYVYGRYIWNS